MYTLNEGIKNLHTHFERKTNLHSYYENMQNFKYSTKVLKSLDYDCYIIDNISAYLDLTWLGSLVSKLPI